MGSLFDGSVGQNVRSCVRCVFCRFSSNRGLYLPQLVGTAIVACMVAGVTSDAGVDTRPDVVLLISDQWRFDWTSFDIPELETPTFRYVAEHGTRFTRAVVPAPLCNPSRASLATGLRYGRHGVFDASKRQELPRNLTTIYQLLREAGVWTADAGKDDLSLLGDVRGSPCSKSAKVRCGSRRAKQLGFDAFARCYGKDCVHQFKEPMDPYAESLEEGNRSLFRTYRDEAADCVYVANISSDGYICPEPSRIPQEHFIDNWIGRRACGLIKAAPKNQPLFLQVNYAGPHPPLTATPQMKESVAGKTWPLARNSSTLNESIQQLMRSNYAAGIQNIDSLNGDVLAAITARGRQTYLCIMSDHGEMLADYWDLSQDWEPLGKSSPWQPAISVPLVCMGPNVTRGRVFDDPVGTIDLAQTILELQGARIPSGLDSVSMKEIFHGSSSNRAVVSTLRDSLHSFSTAQRRFEDGRVYKFVCCIGGCPNGHVLREGHTVATSGWVRRLFDLSTDPHEYEDLTSSLPHVAVVLSDTLNPPFRGCGLDVMGRPLPTVSAKGEKKRKSTAAANRAVSRNGSGQVHKRPDPENQSQEKPDIVLLILDQWRFDWTSFDLPQLETPIFQYVAERGTRFTKAIVPSPLCNPSRASLATGMRYTRHGTRDASKNHELQKNLTTIYQLLRDAGVWTVDVGKDDLSLLGGVQGKRRADQLGFEAYARCYGKDCIRQFRKPMDPYSTSLDEDGRNLFHVYQEEAESCATIPHAKSDGYVCPNASSIPQEDFIDNWIASNARRLIREAPRDRPMFLQVNYAGPHPPLLSTPKMKTSVDGKRWPLAHSSTTLPGHLQQVLRANYAAGIQNIDALNGDLIKELEMRGRFNRTYLCILSDHGEMLGDFWDHSTVFEPFGKSTPWQAAVSVPMACMGPGVPAGRVIEDPVATIDLSKTVLDLQGARVPAGIESVSLKDALHGGSAPNQPVISTLNDANHSFSTILHRRKDGSVYKFVCCIGICPYGHLVREGADVPKDGWSRRLFNLTADPLELADIISERPKVAADLARSLEPPFMGCGLDLSGSALDSDGRRGRLPPASKSVQGHATQRGGDVELVRFLPSADPLLQIQALFTPLFLFFTLAAAFAVLMLAVIRFWTLQRDRIPFHEEQGLLSPQVPGTMLACRREQEKAISALRGAIPQPSAAELNDLRM